MKDVTYASPKAYRRRPGNVFVLAWKNLKEEVRVQFSQLQPAFLLCGTCDMGLSPRPALQLA